MELAHRLCQPHGPYPKSLVSRTLGIARGTLYLQGKQAEKEKRVAVAISQWHEHDDTLGHRKLAGLLKMGKNRVKRVMKKYGVTVRYKKKRYIYPGKASRIAPNLLREKQPQEGDLAGKKSPSDVLDGTKDVSGTPSELSEIPFSDIFEVPLADRTKVRGCFALWKRTRHILSLAFDYSMRADLVVSTIDRLDFRVPGTIWHSDQGS